MNQQLCVDECMYVYFINVVNLLEINILLLVDSYDVFTHTLQGCFTGTGAIICASEVTLNDMSTVSQFLTNTKHRPCAYFLGYTVNQVTYQRGKFHSKAFYQIKILIFHTTTDPKYSELLVISEWNLNAPNGWCKVQWVGSNGYYNMYN